MTLKKFDYFRNPFCKQINTSSYIHAVTVEVALGSYVKAADGASYAGVCNTGDYASSSLRSLAERLSERVSRNLGKTDKQQPHGFLKMVCSCQFLTGNALHHQDSQKVCSRRKR